jgi:hypothetical protein
VSAWRRKALEAFPHLRHDLQRRTYSIYHLFFDLLPLARNAHEAQDAEALRHIHGFAIWCMRQRDKELWNPAGVAFYEHLFDVAELDWAGIIPWIPPDVERDCWPLWEFRLRPEKLTKLRTLFSQARLGLPGN